jgi:radical SAM protein with 4Fe4S-binding SPASM domain
VGGALDIVLEKVKETVRLRNELAFEIEGNSYPMKIGLGFILFKHNEHQVDDFSEIARSIGVDMHQIIDPCVRTVEQGHELLPTDKKHWIYDFEAFENGKLKMKHPPRNECDWIYSTMTIQVNGDVVPCCRDPKGKWVLGNVFKESFDSIWNGAEYRGLRHAVTTQQSKLALCSLCEGYSLPTPIDTGRGDK